MKQFTALVLLFLWSTTVYASPLAIPAEPNTQNCYEDPSVCPSGTTCGGRQDGFDNDGCCIEGYAFNWMSQMCEAIGSNPDTNESPETSQSESNSSSSQDEMEIKTTQIIGFCPNFSQEVCDGKDNNCDGTVDEGCMYRNGDCDVCTNLYSSWGNYCTKKECESYSDTISCTFVNEGVLNKCISERIFIPGDSNEEIKTKALNEIKPKKTVEYSTASAGIGTAFLAVGIKAAIAVGATAATVVAGAALALVGAVALIVALLGFMMYAGIETVEQDEQSFDDLDFMNTVSTPGGSVGYVKYGITHMDDFDEKEAFEAALSADEEQEELISRAIDAPLSKSEILGFLRDKKKEQNEYIISLRNDTSQDNLDKMFKKIRDGGYKNE